MLNLLIFIIILLLIFWLVSLVWSQKIARRVFKIVFYLGLIVAVIFAVYASAQIYRWGTLLHQLNANSFNATTIMNAGSFQAQPAHK